MKTLITSLTLTLSILQAAPIHDASEAGAIERVKSLLQKGENVDIQNTPYKQRPLHLAVYNEHPEIVELLLSHGADANAQMNNGQTPLFIAAYFGDLKSMRLLLEHGANVKVRDHNGNTPLHKAVEGDNPEAVKLLLEHGASLDATDNGKNTPLHIGGYMGSEASVMVLLRRGARIDLRNSDGLTPPEEAYEEDNVRLTKIMERYGAGK